MQSYLLIGLLIALDIFLWVAGAVLVTGSTNRFRLLSCAFIVLWLILSIFFGWKNAAVLSFAGLWIAAILMNAGPWAMPRQSQTARPI